MKTGNDTYLGVNKSTGDPFGSALPSLPLSNGGSHPSQSSAKKRLQGIGKQFFQNFVRSWQFLRLRGAGGFLKLCEAGGFLKCGAGGF